MDPDYGRRYRELYRRHWWWRAREALVLERIAALAPAGGFGRILDVGCGDALLLPRLRRFGRPLGLEADAALISDATRRSGDVVVAPFDERFQPDEPFGLILMLDVLEHLADDVAALRHARRLLVPGGVLLITVPALPVLWTRHDDLNHHHRRYDRRRFHDVAAAAGVAVESARYAFHWLVAAKLLVRLKECLRPGEPRPPSIPPAPVNRLLYAFCRLEAATWGRLPWPAGSSLVAVCRRGREDLR
ncbi:MAG: class I SAM-dependent methyltransferase [Acidobacteria bacterium]|nr:MAG: class I SAM-dependent methyltransferase [Acidobacteriota bacterium]